MVLPSLRRQKDIALLYDKARRFRFPYLTLLIVPSHDGSTRFLVVASRKVGKAVERNRARRRARALLSLASKRLQGQWWIGVICRRELLAAKWSEVGAQVERALSQAGALGPDPPALTE
ncbi:MAG: ribonuclease P protein component [Armatimonadota bacterium]